MDEATPNATAHELRPAWRSLVCLLLFAGAVRWLFYSGFFGSDEVTYTLSAFRLLHGDWTVSSYGGANRYGVNLPVALFALIFGPNEFSAAIYSVLCSIAEIALVVVIGSRMLGTRAAMLAGVLLASLPVHVHFAGRMMADAPLCLAVTASFLLFYDGETRNRRLSFLLAGVAAAWSLWVKPAVLLYLVVFLVYPLLFRRFNPRWAWMVLGFAMTALANNLLFWMLTGQFWYLYKALNSALGSGHLEAGLADGSIRNEPGFYLTYLFLKVYHTGLLAYLAMAAGALWWWKRRVTTPAATFGLRFVTWWGCGLILVLSLSVVSIEPLLLVTKQTNYMLLFVAPLCLLGGHALAQLGTRLRRVLVAVTVGVALLLSALLQASVSVFTANSLATLDFARQRPGSVVYTGSIAYRAASFDAAVRPDLDRQRIGLLNDRDRSMQSPTSASIVERFAVIDMETLNWDVGQPYRRLEELPACWVPIGVLAPRLRGIGSVMVKVMADWANMLPVPAPIRSRLGSLAAPAPAHVFRIPAAGC